MNKKGTVRQRVISVVSCILLSTISCRSQGLATGKYLLGVGIGNYNSLHFKDDLNFYYEKGGDVGIREY